MRRPWLMFFVLCGCQPSQIDLPITDAREPIVPLATRFDAANAGTITGQVKWTGEIPRIDPIRRPQGLVNHDTIPNPNALVTGSDNGIRRAVVWLEGIDPSTAKPWPFPPVTVTLNDDGIFIDGKREGFVRRGDAVTIVGGEKMHGVRGRGADSFATILTPQQPQFKRVLAKAGRIDLGTASHQFWASAALFVMDHPYITHSDIEGKFRLDGVPPGTYKLWAYHPDWIIKNIETDPELGVPARMRYGKPMTMSAMITITVNAMQTVEFEFDSE